jgi:hypothetical protein
MEMTVCSSYEISGDRSAGHSQASWCLVRHNDWLDLSAAL